MSTETKLIIVSPEFERREIAMVGRLTSHVSDLISSNLSAVITW